MRNINTMSRASYLGNNLFYAALMGLWYCPGLFLPLAGHSYKMSLVIFAGVMLAALGVGMLLTWNKRRNYISVAVNVVSGAAAYFVMTYRSITPTAIGRASAAALVFCGLYMVAVFYGYRKSRWYRHPGCSAGKVLFGALLSSRTLAGMVFAVLLAVNITKPLLGLPLQESTVQASPGISDRHSQAAAMAENRDTLALLRESQWQQLDAEARLAVMKTVADLEADYLGIPRLTVGMGVLEEKTMGCYDHKSQTVTLSISYLSQCSAMETLQTVCHEVYHSYQHRMVELYETLDPQQQAMYLFRDAPSYRYEFANYIDGTEDYTAYASQRCEEESNRYGRDALLRYQSWLEEGNR